MGLISLPNVDEIAQEKDPKRQMEMMLNTMGILMKNLSELNGYLNTKNIKELHAEKIVAGTITADKMDIQELSAITANMGKLTSGEIYGAYIATKEAAYPRAELSSTSNLFGAYKDASNSLEISPAFGGGVPAIFFNVAANVAAQISADAAGLDISASARDLEISTAVLGNIRINPESGYNVVFPRGFSAVNGAGTENLANELFSKATKGAATNLNGGHNHGIPDGTVLSVAGGGTVTWSSAAAHAHNQT